MLQISGIPEGFERGRSARKKIPHINLDGLPSQIDTRNTIEGMFWQIVVLDYIINGFSYIKGSPGFLEPQCGYIIQRYFDGFEDAEIPSIVDRLVIIRSKLTIRIFLLIRSGTYHSLRVNFWPIFESIRSKAIADNELKVSDKDLHATMLPYLSGDIPRTDYFIEFFRRKYGYILNPVTHMDGMDILG